MGYVITSAPAAEPLSLTEAKLHLRVEVSEDDALITSIIKAARVAIENYLDQKLVTQTVTEYFDAFPLSGALGLSFWPVQSISSITYTDTDGDTQTWAGASYDVDIYGQYGRGPARIYPAYSESFPSVRSEMNAVAVTYIAGYGAATTVPDLIKAAMRLLIAEMYENRTGEPHAKQMQLPVWMMLLTAGAYKKVI
jgi:uncharacterized phiE125 gp8 family phage protein